VKTYRHNLKSLAIGISAALVAIACGGETKTVYVPVDNGGGKLTDVSNLFTDTGSSSGGSSSGGASSGASSSGSSDAGGGTNADSEAGDASGGDDGGGDDGGGDHGGGGGGCKEPCKDDLPCTKNLCKNGYCIVEPLDGFCIVDGKCWQAGPVPGKPCKVCAPTQAVFGFFDDDKGACDDGIACTTNDVCKSGQCTGTPGPGCCKADADCKSPDGCKQGTCDVKTGGCSFTAIPGCCSAGVCCDAATKTVKPTGTPCGSSVLKTEWGCSGATIRKRTATAGCDGNGAAACSQDVQHATWSPWQNISTCPSGQVCSPIVDPNKQPICAKAGTTTCTSDAMCNDGQACTQDICNSGTCKHVTAPKGAICGADKNTAQYRCNATKSGVEVRFGARVCNGTGSCPAADGKNWGAWLKWSSCNGGTCKASLDPKTPPTCGKPTACKAGTKCCKADGTWAAKATKCGTSALKTEVKCEGTAGGVIKKRQGFAGCSGNSSFCSGSFKDMVAWGAWSTEKTCPADHKCEVNFSGTSAKCVDAKQCKAGTTCCDAKGFYAAKGSKCGTSKYKTEYKCEKAGKLGGAILAREGFKGCSGQSTWCSTLTSNLFWGPWKTLSTCKATEACKDSFSPSYKPSCSNATDCKPTQTCCTTAGMYQPKGTKCGTKKLASETRCSVTGKAIEQRDAYPGCSGNGTTCFSYTSSYYAWTAWKLAHLCPSGGTCKEKYKGKAECAGGSTQCKTYQTCCTPAGTWAKAKTKCGNFAYKTEYKCTGANPATGKGGKVQRRKGYGGCTGSSASCSSSTSNLAWSAWEDYDTCQAHEKCTVTAYSGTCKNVSKCSPSGTCCTTTGEYEKAGKKCGSYPTKKAYKCSGVTKGSDVMVQEIFTGCSGTSGISCSYKDAHLYKAPWKLYKACPATQYCLVTKYSHTCTAKIP